MNAAVFDPRICELGEGAFWHPERAQPFWFDILGRRLMSQRDGNPLEWQFDEMVSACGWIDRDHLLIASETALLRFDLRTGAHQKLVALEPDRAGNRSNDGRADPQGGFWIGTMSRSAETGQGALYRYLDGELRQLRAGLSIPNAICFSPDGRLAYFADTAAQRVWAQALDEQGWPKGQARLFLDLSGTDQFPDGAVTDDQGRFWNARWGSGSVACHAPDGRLLKRLALPASQPSCPCFAGPNLSQLLVTSAAEGRHGPQDGRTWLLDPQARGRPEPRVRA
ncbi:Sugar lactone lactonase YvrE [Paracoccus aminovorans]|uniref:Sugar lactone lactonase YvrE n=1 Tax=Paracoccus aminovorans TaxID=34004 RepID=A0A1I3B5I6_9RHOB|nr:SMP-30/gluconolactonase/LRE family protein [Paracoccus aminovorans]CQR87528.1 Gluconolactonase [Paracoccus aminovorans]SFH57557.1 Sugar lactone lactonase YvrE [Paracoccus aminovorans]